MGQPGGGIVQTIAGVGLSTGSLMFDLTAPQFGLVPNSITNNLNAACKAADAYRATLGTNLPATYYIPSSIPNLHYQASDTILLGSQVSIQGVGKYSTTVNKQAGNVASLFAACVPTGVLVPLGNHLQPLTGIGDSSWASQKGFRTGLANGTSPNTEYAFVCYQPGSMNLGIDKNGFGLTQGLCASWLYQGYTVIQDPVLGTRLQPGPPPPGTSPYAVVDDRAVARPMYIVYEGGSGTVTSVPSTTTLTVSLNDMANVVASFTSGYVTITSGNAAGAIYQVTGAVANGGTSYTLTLATPLAIQPVATDAITYTIGFSVHWTVADGLLNNLPGVYDPTFGGSSRRAGWNYPATYTTAQIVQPHRAIMQLDLTGTTAAGVAQAAYSVTGGALANYASMGPPLGVSGEPYANPFFIENGSNYAFVSNPGPIFNAIVIPYPKQSNSPTTYAGGWDSTLGGFSFYAKTAGGNVFSIPSTIGAAITLNPTGPRPTGTVNDSFMYSKQVNTSFIGCLGCDTSFTDGYYNGRYVHWYGNGLQGGAWIYQGAGTSINPVTGYNPAYGNGVQVRQMNITMQSGGGAAVEHHLFFNSMISDLQVTGGSYIVGKVPTPSGYPIDVLDIIANSQQEAVLQCIEGSLRVYRVVASTPHRCYARMIGSKLEFQDWYGGSLFATSKVGFDVQYNNYTGGITAVNFTYDGENTPSPQVSMFDITDCGSANQIVRVAGHVFTNVGTNCILYRFRSFSSQKAVVVVDISDVTFVFNNAAQSPFAVASFDKDTPFVGKITRVHPYQQWDFTKATLLVVSYAPSGLISVDVEIDLPGITLPPAGAVVPPGVTFTNRQNPTSGVPMRVVSKTGGWVSLDTPP